MEKRISIPEISDSDFKSLKIPVNHWEEICNVIIEGKEYTKVRFEDGLELRFTPMEDSTYSAVLAFGTRDVFHFMWTEVDGVINLTHRIVNPLHRGRGFATEVMSAIERRAEHLSEVNKRPYLFMVETSQVSVVNLCLKRGLKITDGQDTYDNLDQYKIDDNTHVANQNGYQMYFRLSKLFSIRREIA